MRGGGDPGFEPVEFDGFFITPILLRGRMTTLMSDTLKNPSFSGNGGRVSPGGFLWGEYCGEEYLRGEYLGEGISGESISEKSIPGKNITGKEYLREGDPGSFWALIALRRGWSGEFRAKMGELCTRFSGIGRFTHIWGDPGYFLWDFCPIINTIQWRK